jgi:sugar phosphate isomerase/epimerase
MKIQYACTYWGAEKLNADQFFDAIIEAGYDGAEIYLPAPGKFTDDILQRLELVKKTIPGFLFITPQLIIPENEGVDAYINRMEKNMTILAAYQPNFINSHTGKDYYSFDDNCKVIEAALNISNKTGVRILHETHRGRFSFHAATLLPYLKKFPEMELVGDFSHFCTVSESMLQDQIEIIQQIIPHVSHIHARIGHEQGPQVNDPAAPEWNHHAAIFINWWQQIVSDKKKKGFSSISITPEFGPAPYMPAEPFTKKPLSQQWDNNIYMMHQLKKILG